MALNEDGDSWVWTGLAWTQVDSLQHNAVTLSTDADTLLGLTGQQITLDTQGANLVFVGPASGGDVAPTFRALVDADIPAAIARDSELHAELHSIAFHNDTTGTGAELDELTDGSETVLHSHAGGLTVKEEDGTPSISNVVEIKVSNATLTDNGSGSVSISIGAGGANHDILDGSVHQDSVADGVTAGSIIIGNDTPKWDELVISVPAANVRNVLGIDNGETVPSWKTALDATNPAAIGSVSPGTSLVFSHRDHVHAADAAVITFTPNVATDWDGDADPGDVDNALDQLAERVDDLEGGTGLYSLHTYVFVPDAETDTDVATGDEQGALLHSGDNNETVVAWGIDARVAPTGAGIIIQLEYGNTDDLDTVASWTEIDRDTLAATTKSVKFTSGFTNGTITANRLIRMNVDQIGSTEPGENVSVWLMVKRPLVT